MKEKETHMTVKVIATDMDGRRKIQLHTKKKLKLAEEMLRVYGEPFICKILNCMLPKTDHV